MSSQAIGLELSLDEWRILEFLTRKDSISSNELARELQIDDRVVLDSLHVLHYEGLVYFIAQYLGTPEEVVSRITKKGVETLRVKAAAHYTRIKATTG